MDDSTDNRSEPALVTTWWDEWRTEDYSWNGLSKKPWLGWLWSPYRKRAYKISEAPSRLKLIPATLQHYWWDQSSKLIESPDGSEKFTLVHLPLTWRDGSSCRKQQRLGELYNIISVKISSFVDAGERYEGWGAPDEHDPRVQLSGAVFPTGDHGQESILAHIKDADVDLRFAYFDLAADPAEYDLTLSGYISFRGAMFSGGPSFGSKVFQSPVDFQNCIFHGCYFENTIFERSVQFDHSVFMNMAWFKGARFKSYSSFRKCTFGSRARFDDVHFDQMAMFEGSAFLGGAIFNNVAFKGKACFDRTSFLNDVLFAGAVFCSIFEINEAHFEAGAHLGGVHAGSVSKEQHHRVEINKTTTMDGWSGKIAIPESLSANSGRTLHAIYANDAFFGGVVDIMNRDILSPSIFESAVFLGRPLFHGSKLNQRIGFHGAKFLVLEYLANGRRLAAQRRFRRPVCRMLLRCFGRRAALSLRGSAIRRVGRWKVSDGGPSPARNSRWPQSSIALLDAQRRLDGLSDWRALESSEQQKVLNRWALRTEFSRARGAPMADDRQYEKIEAAFRTLKQAMEDSRARLSEGLFFRLELKARRERRDREVQRSERVLSHLYGYLSDYGNSAVRPIMWFTGILLAYAVLYFLLSTPAGDALSVWSPGPKSIHANVWEAVRFSGSRMLPFGAFSGDEAWDWRSELLSDPKRGLLVRALATLQSVIAVVLTFLFALSIRRRFQIT